MITKHTIFSINSQELVQSYKPWYFSTNGAPNATYPVSLLPAIQCTDICTQMQSKTLVNIPENPWTMTRPCSFSSPPRTRKLRCRKLRFYTYHARLTLKIRPSEQKYLTPCVVTFKSANKRIPFKVTNTLRATLESCLSAKQRPRQSRLCGFGLDLRTGPEDWRLCWVTILRAHLADFSILC